MDFLQVNNTTGEIEFVITTTEGQVDPAIGEDNGKTLFVLPDGESPEDYLHNKFYSFKDICFKEKEPKPNEFYEYGKECELIFNEEMFMRSVRKKRNSLLGASDWTQLPDSPLNEEQKAAWAEYRQALRDIPNTGVLNANLIQWPQPPED